MKILIACEFSGIVRDAFLEAGHEVISCDLLPTERPGPHYRGDVRDLLKQKWDLIIAHPPCTYLANSGIRWLYERPERWKQLDDGVAFFRLFLGTDAAPHVAIENLIPHRHALQRIGRRYDQIVRPWMFGDNETKAICLWLRNLPLLKPKVKIKPPTVESKIHYVSGWSKERRKKDRSRFFLGVAKAMAEQWGNQLF